MPPLVRRFLKTGIAFLGIGLAIGLFMLVRRELFDRWPHPYMSSAHVHAVLVGFVMMMILGVALWMFPRAARDDQRFDLRAVEASYWLLALGTAARVGGELARVAWAGPAARWTVVAAGAAQVAGIGLFFWTMWSRIRQPSSAQPARVASHPPKSSAR